MNPPLTVKGTPNTMHDIQQRRCSPKVSSTHLSETSLGYCAEHERLPPQFRVVNLEGDLHSVLPLFLFCSHLFTEADRPEPVGPVGDTS